MSKPVLLGQNNPHSRNPRHALFPHPPGCTGWNILQLLREKIPELTRYRYLSGFDRMNMLDEMEWDTARAAERARVLPSLLAGRTIVVLGAEPRKLLGLPELLIHPLQWHGCEWRQLPHPSGRNRWYNDPHCRDLAASLLAELYERGQQCT